MGNVSAKEASNVSAHEDSNVCAYSQKEESASCTTENSVVPSYLNVDCLSTGIRVKRCNHLKIRVLIPQKHSI